MKQSTGKKRESTLRLKMMQLELCNMTLSDISRNAKKCLQFGCHLEFSFFTNRKPWKMDH